jgi:high-affinity K+ transport system ATPase subunit B
MSGSSFKGILPVYRRVHGLGWRASWLLGTVLRRPLAWFGPARKHEPGPLVLVLPGQLIPADGEIVEGVALVDESVQTGISAALLRESGSERSAVLGGTLVLAGYIRVRIWEGARGATQSPKRMVDNQRRKP